ncbi:chloramphenicol-sensitive protein RarD [Scopulibacillus darangshiensis]|uniref:Chloramphenicol-sensitive protein RarD n=1 Tax=Scopulibacillus darangshiensis TaxID=442528 RepID=A0A4V6NQQ7_9BACL|nr:EamA family transporter RarD [Scopulibacillus darangshiensis]TCP31266.1 chloramphenicol-sensitive protein RarD [Scopulibacillus darangshiensis]
MKSEHANDQMLGAIATIAAYVLWGVMPIYWKLIDGAPAGEILAQRIVWSFIFMIVILLFTGKLKRFASELRAMLLTPKKLLIISAASVVISINWYTYIWAVGHDHVVQASLGYYINPLVSVLLGMIFLKEKLSFWQIISFAIAFIGVLVMAWHVGTMPWVALVLAISFGLYGLLKKLVHLGAMTGLTIETLVITPFALIYLLGFQGGNTNFGLAAPGLSALLIGAGIVTAVPLLLFASGANRIPLSMIGFFQYIAPTLMLILGTFVYHETFNQDQLAAFVLIWASLILYSVSKTKWLVNLENKLRHKQKPCAEKNI